ncbi:MAG TPA: O-antigen ligase family protein [Candidimonas sp.]|nr:O-antigen ligase family protein [Candidimonas sp.]
MLLTLQIYYLVISTLIFLYGIYSSRNASHSFGLGLAANIFPVMFIPYLDMDIARVAGMPLAYLPIIAAGFSLAVRNRLRVPKAYSGLVILSLVFCIYAFITTVFIGGMSVTNFAYWFAWPLNLAIFFSAASFFSRVSPDTAGRVIHATVFVLVAGCVVGLFRYASGIADDANFMPVMNRNGTVVLIAMTFPLLLYLHSEHYISKKVLILSITCVVLALLLTFSRSGLIGVMSGVFIYYMRMSLRGLLKTATAVAIVLVLSLTGIADSSIERLERFSVTARMIMNNEQFDTSMNDYNRVMLLTGAVATAKEEFWFGTGLGLTNYRRTYHRVSNHFPDSKAHNFYLSYFAELGIFGFALLLTMCFLIYRTLPPLHSRFRAFRVSFLVTAIMMTMNEYILLPELWFFYGLLSGVSISSARHLAELHYKPQPLKAWENANAH